MKYNEIKPILLSYWENFHKTNSDIFRTYQDVLRFQKKQIRRIKEGSDLIDMRDIIRQFFEFSNKSKYESFLDFRNSGKQIDSFTPINKKLITGIGESLQYQNNNNNIQPSRSTVNR